MSCEDPKLAAVVNRLHEMIMDPPYVILQHQESVTSDAMHEPISTCFQSDALNDKSFHDCDTSDVLARSTGLSMRHIYFQFEMAHDNKHSGPGAAHFNHQRCRQLRQRIHFCQYRIHSWGQELLKTSTTNIVHTYALQILGWLSLSKHWETEPEQSTSMRGRMRTYPERWGTYFHGIKVVPPTIGMRKFMELEEV